MNAIETIIAAIRPTVAQVTDDFYPNVVTFAQAASHRSDSGQLVEDGFEAVDELTDLRALVLTQAQYMERVQGAAMFGTGLTFNVGDFIVFLGAYYPDIDSAMRMTDEDGVEYEVTGVRPDPFGLMTILTVHRSDLTDGS